MSEVSVSASARITTDTSSITDLITGIKRGEIKIPQFQRQFVWKDQQALNLLDSIAKNYPIGSLLLWKTTEKLKTERNIGEFRLPETDDLSPTDYVLDGQQRLTVIYSCLGASPSEDGFSVSYDLENDCFTRSAELDDFTFFPLRFAFKTTQLLDFRTRAMGLPNGPTYQTRLDRLIDSFGSYKLPVVTLKDLTVLEVCPIFERINSSGTKLSTFDLMVAATWNPNFDLNEQVASIQESLEAKGFDDINPTTVLKCMTAIEIGSIKEESLKSLRAISASKMHSLVSQTKHCLLRTVDALSTEFKVHSWEFLSYEAVTVILCRIFSRTNSLSPAQNRRLRQWFWRSSFSERYKVGGENFVSNDLDRVAEFVISGSGNASMFGAPPTEGDWKTTNFRSNSSRSRAFILALASRTPRNISNGSKIDTIMALSSYNKRQFHHVFPRAFLKRTNEVNEDNVLLNICMLAAAPNNSISDSNPNVYLPQLALDLNDEADEVFASNLLPRPSTFNYSISTYSDFLTARYREVQPFVSGLCDGK